MRNPPVPVDGSTLARQRKLKGLTQKELAKASLLSIRTIQKMERGEAVDRAKSIQPVADALGIDPSAIINGYVPPAHGKKSPSFNDTRGRRRADVVIQGEFEELVNSPELKKRILEIVKLAKCRYYVVIIGAAPSNSVRVTIDFDEEDIERLRFALYKLLLMKKVMDFDLPDKHTVEKPKRQVVKGQMVKRKKRHVTQPIKFPGVKARGKK